MIVFITGGARSGKSRYAMQLAESLSEKPLYVATARIWDDDFRERVNRHIRDRKDTWTCIEEEKHLSQLDLEGRVAVIDCVTLWLTNFFTDTGQDTEACLELAEKEIDGLASVNGTLIIVSNEIGMGVHAHSEAGRKFTDLQGWTNQRIAAKAGKVIFMVSGIPMTLKE